MVCPEVEALAMRLWASYSIAEALGSPWRRSSVPGAVFGFAEASVFVPRYLLVDRALSSPGEGPKFLSARQGWGETRDTNRLR